MIDFDADVNSFEDLLANLEDEVDLADPKWNFKYHVKQTLSKFPDRTRSEVEWDTEVLIRTKFTSKRCACGEVAQFMDKERKIYCGRCWYAIPANNNDR